MKKVVKGFASIAMFASMIFVVACKPPIVADKGTITITVKGDEHVEKIETETLSVAKGSTWSTIKSKIKVTYNDGYGTRGWKLNDASGKDLTDDYSFTADTTVYAYSEKLLTITVDGDDHVTGINPKTLFVAKGSEWSAVKPRIKVKYKKGFVEAGWKLNDASGKDLADDYSFTADTTVYAYSKDKVTIRVKGDERIDLSLPLQIEKPYDTKWSDIKAEIEGKIKPSAAWEDDWNKGVYVVYEWRLDDENGEKINDAYTFSDNTTVYAVSNYVNWIINDDGSGNKVLYFNLWHASKPRGKIIIPDSVTKIQEWFFSDCSELTGITIPASVTSIGERVFDNCEKLETLTVDSDNTVYKSDKNIIYTKDGKSLIAVPNRLSGTIDIPDGVSTIEEYAFSGCSSLTGITIPDGVTSIGDNAFYGCSALSAISIPASVTSIGKYAFGNCSSLADISIQNGVRTIGDAAFSYCSSLTDITIPTSVTSIGDGLFFGCMNLTTLTIDSGNTVYKSDKNIIYTKDGTSLIAVPNGLSGTIDIPDGVSTIGKYAFSGCSELTGITIPDSVTSIGKYAFNGCLKLSTITIPNSVTSIGPDAFNNCNKLTSLSFADPKGWAVYEDSNYKIPRGIFEESDLKDKSKAAELLRDTYCGYYWKKN